MPVTLILPDTGLRVRGTTRDISAGGVYFHANLPVSQHQAVDLLMTIPYQFSSVRVICHAKVVRVDADIGSGSKGIAAAIQRFDFLEAEESVKLGEGFN